MSRSKRWKGMDLEAGGDGITVERRRDSSGFDWLCDLWLAETGGWPSARRTRCGHNRRGRLAQLGERLVYTEEVVGSNPAPPIAPLTAPLTPGLCCRL